MGPARISDRPRVDSHIECPNLEPIELAQETIVANVSDITLLVLPLDSSNQTEVDREFLSLNSARGIRGIDWFRSAALDIETSRHHGHPVPIIALLV
jgi:hypothetical protein